MVRGQDAAYARTRREGSTGTITRVTDTTVDAKTGDQSDTEVVTTVRWLVKEPTQYFRYMRAEAVGEDIGDTTFVAYLPDLNFTEIDQEAFITFGGLRYEVVTNKTEDNALVITAKRVK